MRDRSLQLVFIIATCACCWFGMMAMHEVGHIVGGVVTGGTVERVVLHPLAISRTDVEPNPHPAIVVWLGPIIGCLLPLMAWLLTPRRLKEARTLLGFFAGFCLVANGAYIGVGSFDHVGDCREMLRTGSPVWLLIAFGVVSTASGFGVWHSLGSLRKFATSPERISERTTCCLLTLAAAYATVVGLLSQRV